MTQEPQRLEDLVPYLRGAGFVAKQLEARIEDPEVADHAHRIRRLAAASLDAVQDRLRERDGRPDDG